MLAKTIKLLLRDRKALYWHVKIKLAQCCCSLFARSGFYVQGKMDIDPKSMWHNKEFVAGSGGYFVPGDPVQRSVGRLEPWDCVRRDLIVLLLRSLTERSVNGDMAEIGVYKGSTAKLIHHYAPERKLYLFDTFSGFDERDVRSEKEKTGLKTSGKSFSDTNVEIVSRNIDQRNDNVQLFAGFFPASAPEFLRDRKFAFVHLDADLYDPILAGLTFFYEKVVPGGIILVHDYNSWPGARKAVDDFFASKPEVPIPMPDKSGSVVIVKNAPKAA